MARLMFLLMIASGCDYITTPEQREATRKTKALEDKIASLETQLAAKESSAADREMELDSCLMRAERSYWSYVRLNGRLAKNTPEGPIYRASAFIWQQAASDKANAIAECRATWGK